MPISYVISANPIWQFTDKTGRFLANGRVWTYKNTDYSVKKATYQDPGGILEYPNPIPLDGVGSITPIYWADDEGYYVEVREINPLDPTQPGELVYQFELIPGAGGGGAVTINTDYENLITNGQFLLHNAATLSGFEASTLYSIGAGWVFYKDNATADDKIIYNDYLPGALPEGIEGNPAGNLQYVCSSAGSGEGTKYKAAIIDGVQNFEGKAIVIALVAKSLLLNDITIKFEQNFGTGGAPSAPVITEVGTTSLTNGEVKYFFPFVVPSIDGKTIGANKDDHIKIRVELPLNALSSINIVNVQLNVTTRLLPYQQKTPPKTLAESVGALLLSRRNYWNKFTGIGQGGRLEDVRYLSLARGGNEADWDQTTFGLQAHPPIGSSMEWFTDVPPDGWWILDGSYKAKAESPRLYAVPNSGGRTFGTMYTDTTKTNNLNSIVVSNLITSTMFANGAVEHVADVNTGFTFNVTQNGDSTHKEIFTITCTAATLLNGGEYFTFQVPDGTRWAGVLIVDNNYLNFPTIAGRNITWAYINKSDDASTVADKLCDMLNPLVFGLPDLRGYTTRSVDGGAGRDPNAATRTARPDGSSGNVVGTTQQDEFKSHGHPFSANYNNPCGGDAYDTREGSGSGPPPRVLSYAQITAISGTTSLSGGDETRMKNFGVYKIIKY